METSYAREVWRGGIGLEFLQSERRACGGVMERYYRGIKPFFSGKAFFEVCNGRRVKFWKDRCCEDKPLCVSFASLYAFALLEEAWVVDIWDDLDEGGPLKSLFL